MVHSQQRILVKHGPIHWWPILSSTDYSLVGWWNNWLTINWWSENFWHHPKQPTLGITAQDVDSHLSMKCALHHYKMWAVRPGYLTPITHTCSRPSPQSSPLDRSQPLIPKVWIYQWCPFLINKQRQQLGGHQRLGKHGWSDVWGNFLVIHLSILHFRAAVVSTTAAHQSHFLIMI